MTDEQRVELRRALAAVHDLVHTLYPREAAQTNEEMIAAKTLRDRLLVVDLAMHLAEEVAGSSTNGVDKDKTAERAVNLLYALRLVIPDYRLERAAEMIVKNAG